MKKKSPPEKKIRIHGQDIEWENSHVYLGVTLDSTLNFKKHVENKLKTAKAAKGKLLPIVGSKSKISPFNRLLILTQLFMASMLYACPVWAEAAYDKLSKIAKFQQNFMKAALGLPRFASGTQVERHLCMKTAYERIQETFSRYLEKIDEHPNRLVRQSVQYDLLKYRKRKRPRDYLLRKPP